MAIKLLFSLCIGFLVSFQVLGAPADTVNQVDKKGLKQGYWTKKFENGKPVYEGYFKDDKPVGRMVRFYQSGAVRAIMDYKTGGRYCSVTFYYENGTKQADGFFADNKKDSTWQFYSYYSRLLNSVENYKEGKKHGVTQVYYPSGKVFDETEWSGDRKHGKWLQYFEDGKIKMATYHENGILQGDFNLFFENGSPEITGQYVNNVRQGSWLYYKDKGEKILEVAYDKGKALNQEVLDEKEQAFFKQMEENLGKINEPEPEDFVGF